MIASSSNRFNTNNYIWSTFAGGGGPQYASHVIGTYLAVFLDSDKARSCAWVNEAPKRRLGKANNHTLSSLPLNSQNADRL